MSDANLTRFRCPQCRSRSIIDVAVATVPYLCPTCHVELEPLGKAVNPSAVTTEITPAERAAIGPPPAVSLPSNRSPAAAASGPREIDYLQKIHFWVRLIAALVLVGLLLGAWATFFK